MFSSSESKHIFGIRNIRQGSFGIKYLLAFRLKWLEVIFHNTAHLRQSC